MINELEKLRLKLDHYYSYSDDFRVWKREKEKWDYYKAKLLVFTQDLKKARNFYLGVLSSWEQILGHYIENLYTGLG